MGLVTSCANGVASVVDLATNSLVRNLSVGSFPEVDADAVFDTKTPPGQGPRRAFTSVDTAECGYEQIIALVNQ